METSGFLLILFSGVVMGLLLSMSMRWLGGKFLTGNHRKEGGSAHQERLVKNALSSKKKEVFLK